MATPEYLASIAGHRVQVYRNLSNGLWSVKHGKDPVFHLDTVYLEKVIFHVSEAGRERVRRQKQREVHAWATGVIVDQAPACTVGVTYNPFRDTGFMRTDSAELRPITRACFAAFETRPSTGTPGCYINDFPF